MVGADCFWVFGGRRAVYFLDGMGLARLAFGGIGAEYYSNGYFCYEICKNSSQRVPGMPVYDDFGYKYIDLGGA